MEFSNFIIVSCLPENFPKEIFSPKKRLFADAD
jgi:thymidine kinase